MVRTIFLIGFRAVGKSTVGKKLAEKMNIGFIDTDQLICEQQGTTINTIVQSEGWDAFRSYEADVLRATGKRNPYVVSTGGGAVLHRKVWLDIKKHALVVWLTAHPDIILRRINADTASREMRPSLSSQDLEEEIIATLSYRLPFYEELADFTVDTEKLGVDEAVKTIVVWLNAQQITRFT